jgi:hypothetical protein
MTTTFSADNNPFLRASKLFNNPFQTVQATDVAADAPEGSYTYALVSNGSTVTADECEDAAEAIEVVVKFGSSVLCIEHLTPPRAFFLGEQGADCVVPASALGADRAQLVSVDGGSAKLCVPPGARVMLDGKVSDATEIALNKGTRPTLEIGGLLIEVGAVNAGRKVAGRVKLDGRNLPFQGLSFLIHAGLLAMTAVFMPPLAMADEGSVPEDQRYEMRTMLGTFAEREPEQKQDQASADSTKQDNQGGTGTRAAHEEGSMGSDRSRNTNGRYGIQGDSADPHAARIAAIRDAQEFGMVGLLNSGAGGDMNAPTAWFGRDDSAGRDALSAKGNMWGSEIAEAYGAGGLGLTGIGEGAGGTGEGIGLGHIGTIGNGSGLGDGQGFGPGHGHSGGVLGNSHKVGVPQVRLGVTSASGHLPPEVIQRVVRQNFGRFRLCYENGLRTSPSLNGRVSVRFVIGRDGAVSNVSNGGSDMPDAGVVGCVVRAFYGLSFPAPESGIVTVTYPITFSPGGNG